MENSVLTLPANLNLWILATLVGVIFTIIGVIYNNLLKKVDTVNKDLLEYKKCTDARIESLLLDLTKISERVISKAELTEVINKAVTEQFLKWENRLLKDGQIKPSKKGD